MIKKNKNIILKRCVFISALSLCVCILFSVYFSANINAKETESKLNENQISIKTPQTVFTGKNKSQTKDGKGLGYNSSGVVDVKKTEKNKLEAAESLPLKYDLRNINGKNYVTPVKNQGDYGTCWAFATLSSAESNILRNGIAGEVDLSEWHLAYFHYYQDYNFGDPLSNRKTSKMYYRGTYGDGNKVRGELSYSNNYLIVGGSEQMASRTLAAWKGFAAEHKFKYSSIKDWNSSINNKEAYNNNEYHLDDSIWVNYPKVPDNISNTEVNNNFKRDIAEIKKCIKNYGAGTMSFYWDDYNKYYDTSTCAYYGNGGEDSNHAVSVVGWDDSFSKDNFKSTCKPPFDGAWILKNSFGKEWGNDGYFYLSYYDGSISNDASYFMTAKKISNGEKNYQYDGSGGSSYITSEGKKLAKEANVFVSDNSYQKLSSIALELGNTDTTINAWVYTDLQDKTKPESGVKTKIISNKKISQMGYYTLDLDKHVNVKIAPNTLFSIVVEKQTANEDLYIPLSANMIFYDPIDSISASKNDGYYDFGDGFQNVKDIDKAFGINNPAIRLKAHTVTSNYTITTSAGVGGKILFEGGKIRQNKVTINSGSNATFRISANKGYEIANVIVDGKSIGKKSSYTFKDVSSDHSIRATFKSNGRR